MIPPFISELCQRNKLLVFRYFVSSIGKAVCSGLLIVMIQQFLAVTHHSAGSLVRFLSPILGADFVPLEMAALLLTFHLLNSYLTYDNKVTSQRLSETLEYGLMERIIRILLRLSVQFFKKQTAAELFETSRQDVFNMRTMAYAYSTIVQSSLMGLAFLVMVFWLNPLLAFVSLILLPFAGTFAMRYTRKHVRVAARQLRARRPFFMGAIIQITSGIRIIKAYNAEATEERLNMENLRIAQGLTMRIVRLQSMMQVLLESLGGLSMVTVITLGGYEVARGTMSWDGLVAFVFSARSLFGPVYEIQRATADIQGNHVSVERVTQLLESQPDVDDRPDAIPLGSLPQTIRFENVGFSYGGPDVLHNVSFEARAGETIGIVGPSGGGKSTLLNLVVRFYDPTSGRVTFDGADLRTFRLADVYRHISIVTQDPFLFATTARENIRCARPGASDAEVEAAAQDAQIHDDILALPQGYETPVGPGGREISRGQSQRINIARALLKNAPLLILDEATASLDSVAETQVQRAIDRLMVGRTCFIVAHRLSTLRDASRLLVLDYGKLVGFGTHEDLLRGCELYRRMWELQILGDRRSDAEPIGRTPNGPLGNYLSSSAGYEDAEDDFLRNAESTPA